MQLGWPGQQLAQAKYGERDVVVDGPIGKAL